MREDDYYKSIEEIIGHKYNVDKYKYIIEDFDIIKKIRNDAYERDDDWKTHEKLWERKSNEEILEDMPVEEIEKFLRKKKLERIEKSSS